jgi:hypothetical protein
MAVVKPPLYCTHGFQMCITRRAQNSNAHTHTLCEGEQTAALGLSLIWRAECCKPHSSHTACRRFLCFPLTFFLVREQGKQDVNLFLPLGAVTPKIISRPATHGPGENPSPSQIENERSGLTEIHISCILQRQKF